jgi:hypothetical protein
MEQGLELWQGDIASNLGLSLDGLESEVQFDPERCTVSDTMREVQQLEAELGANSQKLLEELFNDGTPDLR